MGNKLGRRKQVVDEKYTRPQGLYQIKDVDYKKLRKLILESKLAPCFPGGDDCDTGILEECPICFLYYPTLNRSRCCTKSICTECFLQMKNPNSTRPTQCPFCKTSNYAVEYRGEKSKEEKGMEQIEEQKFIEAKIRMRQQQQQLQLEEESNHRTEDTHSSNMDPQTENIGCSTSGGIECEENAPSLDSSSAQMFRQPQYIRHGRDDEFDLDLEDIMVMEAIWLSMKENERGGHSPYDDALPEPYTVEDHYNPPAAGPVTGSSSSPSGGLACAIAALAARQQLTGESSSNNYSRPISPLDMLPSKSSRSSKRMKKTQRKPTEISSTEEICSSRILADACEVGPASEIAEVGPSYVDSDDSDSEAVILAPPPPPPPPPYRGRWNSKRGKNIQRKLSKNMHGRRMVAEEWEYDRVAEAGTTRANSDDSDEDLQATILPPPPPPLPPYEMIGSSSGSCGAQDHGDYLLPPPPLPYVSDCGFQSSVPSPIVPENFEEQMMLAMAVSLADSRNRTTAQGVAWH